MGIKDDPVKRKLLISAGMGDMVKKAMFGICPLCNTPASIEDCRDELSRKEFAIAGICQKCQDEVFE